MPDFYIVCNRFHFNILSSFVRSDFRSYFVSVLLNIFVSFFVSVNKIISISVSISISVNKYITGDYIRLDELSLNQLWLHRLHH